jgi:hypothetical protein
MYRSENRYFNACLVTLSVCHLPSFVFLFVLFRDSCPVKVSPTLFCHTPYQYQANYINALAVYVSPFYEPARVTLGGLFFSPWVDFLMTLGGFFLAFGELLKFCPLTIQLYSIALWDSVSSFNVYVCDVFYCQ